MKIALVAGHLAPRPAGTDSYPGDPAAQVLSLATALAGHGQQVTVYGHGDTAAVARTAPGVTVEPVPGRPPGGGSGRRAAGRQLGGARGLRLRPRTAATSTGRTPSSER